MYYYVEINYYDKSNDTLDYCDTLEEAREIYNWANDARDTCGVRAAYIQYDGKILASFNAE